MSYQYLLFDLDGTLSNPGIGITNAVMYALKKFNIEVKERESLFKFIGPPLWDSFMEYYQFTKEQADQAVIYFREYYGQKGKFENYLYDDTVEVLEQLIANGKTLILATSKLTSVAEDILEHFDLRKYFSFVAGSNKDGSRCTKGDVIEYALNCCHITDKSQVVMIGDREHDILGAKQCGLDSIGVLYGYGDRAEHEAAGATYIVESEKELIELTK